MKSTSKLACGLTALLLAGCTKIEKPTEPAPSPNDLRYDTKHTMVFDKSTSEFRTSFSGTRCYSTTAAGTSQHHNFVFDDNVDTLTVTVNDVSGLFPGDTYSYILQHIDPATSSTLHSWQLELGNPETATKKLHYFEFKIARNTALTWKQNTVVAGLFKFGQTNRPLSVDLQFNVGNTVNLLSACEPND